LKLIQIFYVLPIQHCYRQEHQNTGENSYIGRSLVDISKVTLNIISTKV